MTADEKRSPTEDPKHPVIQTSQLQEPAAKRFAAVPFGITFIILICFWVVFSGRFDLFHLSMGVICCLLVAYFSSNMLFPTGMKPEYVGQWIRFAAYLPWLIYQVLLANLHLLRLSFHPRMMDLIDPHIIVFKSSLESDIARTTFANSITLTPGTITINVSPIGRFAVHSIDVESSEPLPGEMESRIASIFRE